jgi:hypothetical protein
MKFVKESLSILVCAAMVGLSSCSTGGAATTSTFATGGGTAANGTGLVGLAFSLPSGLTINQVQYSVTGPTTVAGTIDISNAMSSVEFVVGGLQAGPGYTIVLSATDTQGDNCVSAPTSFVVQVEATTQLTVNLVCAIGDGGFVFADAGTGSVEIDASVTTFNNPTTVCPVIAAFSASPAEEVVGATSAVVVATAPAGAAVTYQVTPTTGLGNPGAGTVSGITPMGATFTCTTAGQVQLTVSTTAPLANDAGNCPTQSMSALINCEPAPCTPNQITCNGVCTSTQSDANNCGACGNVCPAGDSCTNGACATPCPAGLTLCSGACINLQSDPGNCGMCNSACPSNETCSGGVCAITACPQGESMCNGMCIPTSGDLNNCGGCGIVCSPGDTCQQGVCQTPPQPGGDLVVFDDMNPFDNTAMQNANNPIMVANLVNFTGTGPRAMGTVVWMDYGRNSKCGGTGECGPSSDSMTYSVIQAQGLTITNISSTSGSLTSVDSNVKVVFLWNPEVAYTLDEVNAFRQFASEGGRIVFLGEWGQYYGATGINVENAFLVDMGALMTNTGAAVDCGYTDLPAASLRPHEVTSGMTGVRVACASVITPGPHDYPLYYDSTNTQLLAGVAAIATAPLTALPDPTPVTPQATTFNPNSSTGM